MNRQTDRRTLMCVRCNLTEIGAVVSDDIRRC